MTDLTTTRRLLIWAMASLHASALVFAAVFYLWLTDGLRFGSDNDSGSFVGLLAFAALWAASLFGTIRALPAELPRGLTSDAVSQLIGVGVIGGAFSGSAFLLAGVVVAAPIGLIALLLDGEVEQIPALIAVLALFGTIGTGVALVIGGAVGMLVAIVDCLLLGLATSIVGKLPGMPSQPDARTPAA